jgi:hypothetical protein
MRKSTHRTWSIGCLMGLVALISLPTEYHARRSRELDRQLKAAEQARMEDERIDRELLDAQRKAAAINRKSSQESSYDSGELIRLLKELKKEKADRENDPDWYPRSVFRQL